MRAAFKSSLFVLFVLFLFAFGFCWRDIRRGGLPSKSTLASMLDLAVAHGNVTPEQEFAQNYDRIRSDYYKPVGADRLTYAGMSGLMASLGDPHTMFMEPQLSSEFSLETKAPTFVGVGARLEPNDLGAKAISVFEDGPAAQAGLKKGDIITGVNAKSVVGMNIDDIVAQIRGEEGLTVKLKLIRPDVKDPVVIAVRRAKVETPTVMEIQVLPGTDFGYFQVATFSEPTARQFDDAIEKLEKKNIKGLIIDMRDNPGGLLDTATDMLSRFLDHKLVVMIKGRGGEQEAKMTSSGETHKFAYPIVILINEDSASAAEIFSGVLQDYKLAELVGNHSYGKASVQNVIQLVGGSSAKITIAHYFLPSGRNIGRTVDDQGQYLTGGLQPDIKASLDLDSAEDITLGDPKTDTQLQKAEQVLQQKTGSR